MIFFRESQVSSMILFEIDVVSFFIEQEWYAY